MVQRCDVGVLGLAAAIGWSKILRPTRHKIDHFGDVLPSQSLVSVLKTPNKTRCKAKPVGNPPAYPLAAC